MNDHDRGLRKAAILIDALDQASADALLERLTGESADRIRRELLELEFVQSAERRGILGELGGYSPASGRENESNAIRDETSQSPISRRIPADANTWSETTADDVTRNRRPAHRIPDREESTLTVNDAVSASSDALSESEPFAFLSSTPMDLLSSYLAGEHPQAVSIVLAHLAPQRAAEFLATLSGERRADVLRRLARLDVTDADVINDVERGLQALLADRILADQQRPLGLATLEAILDAVDDEQRTEFLGHLRSAPPASRDEGDGLPAVFDVQQERDARGTPHVLHARIPAADFPQRAGNLLDALAAPVCSHRGPAGTDAARRVTQGAETVLEFEDFAELSDTALARIFRAADPQVALLALCGAGRDLVDRILGRLPLREARVLRRQIEQLGPTRLRDIESAQRRLAESAGRMADEGQIQIPGNRRFTVAA